MNQDKIGKLIAKLRKEKGLTQQELGEKVNVGSRAVSKWERGLTLPDITIINELSGILGITSDELLKGELNNSEVKSANKKSFNYKFLLIIISLLIIAIGIILFINNKDKNEVYLLKSVNQDEYQIEGNITINNNNLTIFINKVEFEDYSFNQMIIKNCEYYLLSGNKTIYRYNYNQLTDTIDPPITIINFFKTFKLNYRIEKINDINEILNNDIYLKLIFVDKYNNQLTRNIKIQTTYKNGKKWFNIIRLLGWVIRPVGCFIN